MITPTIITPEMAARQLDAYYAAGGRSLIRDHVACLAAKMLRGEWVLDYSSIHLSASGNLIDGAHRIAAIVRAGVPVTMLVVQPNHNLMADPFFSLEEITAYEDR